MADIRKQWEQVLAAGSDPNSNASIGTRFGLMFDPLHYVADAFGFQDNYDRFVNKSGDWFNKQGSSVVKPIDKVHRKYDPLHKAISSTPEGDMAANWITNKPASAAGLVYGGIAGGSALLGGGASGAGGGASSGGQLATYGEMGGMQGNAGLGVFANGGTGGMAGVGGGNAGALAASGGISGGAGVAGLDPKYVDYAAKLNGMMGSQNSAQPSAPYQMGGSRMSQGEDDPAAQQTTLAPNRQRGFNTNRMGPFMYRGQIVWL